MTGRPVSAQEADRIDRRRTLELSRARLTADLQRASVPAHRAMLEQALTALDHELRALDPKA